LFADVVTVRDGLDTQQLIEAAQPCERRHGKLHRVLGILEPLQVQLAEVRAALGVPGTRPQTADLFRDKARMKDELRRTACRARGTSCSAAGRRRGVRRSEVGLAARAQAAGRHGLQGDLAHELDRRAARRARRAARRSPAPGAGRGVPARARVQLRDHHHRRQGALPVVSRYFPTPLEVMETRGSSGWWCCRATSTAPSSRTRARWACAR
jgi:hypothetical protein